MILVSCVVGLVQELRGHRARFHPSSQQETRLGIVMRFLGWPCEFATPDCGCSYPGLGWRCGHRSRDGLVPCAPSFVDVVELPGEAWRGKWRVTAWGTPGEIAADVDVDASGESDALDKALAVFEARTPQQWREELPAVFGAQERPQKRACPGPIYFADQGIEVCTACGGCICCDFNHVDHSAAEYECFTDGVGVCHLKMHAGGACTKAASP